MGLLNNKKWEKEKIPDARIPGGGVVAVWGSPGSGKTTVSIKLAEYLTSKGNNVLLIFTDMNTPVVPYVTFEKDIESERSLGSVLAAARVTEELVKKNCMLSARNRYLTYMGMLKGESTFSYPQYDYTQTEDLLRAAEKIVPFVIVDCSSDFLPNRLTTSALLLADTVIRLCNCDRKSASYFKSQEYYFSDEVKWEYKKHLVVGSNIRKNQAAESIESLFGPVAVKIPHSEEVEEQFLCGDLFKRLEYKESREFRNSIEKISREVFGI